ncbi:unnamed protein product [Haemonchus placei]|uniref:Transposase n=1 Tax=Haemonchus placei TaxID=6290 RepID=A0A0N4X1V3_HAEPC|nr:unnamed protein product [Haemonchus placei]
MVKPSSDRPAIVRLHKACRPPATIAKHLGIHRSDVYRTFQGYGDLGELQGRPRSGIPRIARTPKVVEAVRKRIAGNATGSVSTMARDMGIAEVVQAWCKSERPDFISAIPLDYNLWSYLESNACATPHPNLDSLKAALIREWDGIDDALLRTVIDAFPKRLRAVVRAKGGRIEK